LPCNGSDLRDFARIQKGICGTAEGSPDIEGDDELPRGAGVPGTHCVHDGSESKATDRDSDCNRPIASISLSLATLFLYRTEIKGRHTGAIRAR